jgi:phosphopantetheinyl transferase (holo-ACP synthase)
MQIMNPETLVRIDRSDADLKSWLSPLELTALSSFEAPKRRSDWTLGRAAAKQAVREALTRLGYEAPAHTSFSVVSSEEGAPALTYGADCPERLPPVAITLTHGHGQAAAWALPPGAAGGLPGIDLELVRPRRLGTLRFYLHPEEREWVLELPGSDVDPPPKGADPTPRDQAAIVLWSLKEAAFKALQPPRGTGLLDVAVELEDPFDAPQGRARITYRGTAVERASQLGATSVEAGWTQSDGLVLAWTVALGARLP